MKKIILFSIFLFSIGVVKAQSLDNISDVLSFMKNKTYYSEETQVTLELKYISEYNTYGIVLRATRTGNKLYYINLDVDGNGSYADVSGMSTNDGSSFKFRVYLNRDYIVIGIGESRQGKMYMKE